MRKWSYGEFRNSKWVKSHSRELIEKFVNAQGCFPDPWPTTLFMAGSPGAGKTEISKRLLARFKLQAIRSSYFVRLRIAKGH